MSYNSVHLIIKVKLKNDLLAQLVEQFPFKEWAHGSNP